MTAGELMGILSKVPPATDIALLLSNGSGEPDFATSVDVGCVMIDYTGDAEVESVSIVYP